MGVQGDRIFAAISARGFPDPWATFGEHLSWEAAYAVQLKAAIEYARKDATKVAFAEVTRLFKLKGENLDAAAHLLGTVLVEYDENGMWTTLDNRASKLDIADVSERWAHGLVAHPFPIALLSLQFNWRYMKQNGVRAFYKMTARYVADLIQSNQRWREAIDNERKTGVLDRVTTVEADLASEEAPMHCDICQKTITALLYLE